MADSTSIIADLLLTQNQSGKEAAANDLFNSASPAMLWALDPATTTGLTFGLIGGRYKSASIANDDVTLTDATTNYIVAAVSDGTVSVSTATTNWNDQTTYIRLYKVVTASGSISSYEDHRQSIVSQGALATPTKVIQIACSDETTAIVTGTPAITFRMPFAMTLNSGTGGVRASLSTAQTSGSTFQVDINETGSGTILSTKLTIDNGEKTSVTAATPVVISDTALADDAEITIDIDVVGDGTAKGLKVTLIGT
jgi:hypothetical protein